MAQILDHVGINHRRLHILMPEIFLNLPYVHPIEEQNHR
jgi:hypothetical protein